MCITQISDGDGITDIAELLPAGSAVAVVAAGAENASEYMRKMRRAGIKPRLLVACGEQRRISCPNIDDDVRLIAAYGGESEADCAKLLGKERILCCGCSRGDNRAYAAVPRLVRHRVAA